MEYYTYSVHDFVLDEAFQQWVKQPRADQQTFWEEWLARHPEKKETVEQARLILLAIDFPKTPVAEIDHQGMWQKIQQVTSHEPQQVALVTAPRTIFWRSWRGVAAALTLVLLAGAGYVAWLESRTTRYATPYGSRQAITLPDGSTVTLNANSTLRYRSDWSQPTIREVWLEGEAFFKVVKQNRSRPLPFVVHTGSLDVQVLGTEFNVRNRHEQTTVVLNEGRVQLATDAESVAQPLVMQPGDLIQFSEKDYSFTRRSVRPEKYSSWTQDLLTFDNATLREVAQVLEDTYGLQVTFEQAPLARRTFTATLPVNRPQTLLLALAESLNLDIQQRGNAVLIRSNP